VEQEAKAESGGWYGNNCVLPFNKMPRPVNELIIFNENRQPIRHEKRPNQRAGSISCGFGMGSVQGIQVSGLFGRGRHMDKLLYRQEIEGFRQSY
jgi:hypothetical protein